MSRLRRLFSRSTPSTDPAVAPTGGDARRATMAHFEDFVRTRVGVEAYVEPPTRTTAMTVVLVATTGEWTRRRVPDERAARALAQDLAIPAYDVRRTGYPQRMRDWNSRQRSQGRSDRP